MNPPKTQAPEKGESRTPIQKAFDEYKQRLSDSTTQYEVNCVRNWNRQRAVSALEECMRRAFLAGSSAQQRIAEKEVQS